MPKDLLNTGLVEAGNRLDALASNNIVNKSGGMIAGRDVGVTAVTGDVLNQRDVTGINQTAGFVSTHRELETREPAHPKVPCARPP